jgi:hypothetical protein
VKQLSRRQEIILGSIYEMGGAARPPQAQGWRDDDSRLLFDPNARITSWEQTQVAFRRLAARGFLVRRGTKMRPIYELTEQGREAIGR